VQLIAPKHFHNQRKTFSQDHQLHLEGETIKRFINQNITDEKNKDAAIKDGANPINHLRA
jgi:hypothetical protein